jgi:hypothetical protein
MKAIQEIIGLLQKCGIRSADQLKVPFKNQSKSRQFFHFIQKNSDEKEQDLAQQFFQDLPSTDLFQRTRRSLENQLVQALFLIDVNKLGSTARQRAYYHCWKNLCAVKILLGQSAHHAAIRLTKKMLRRATKHQFSDLCLESYKILRWYYGCMDAKSSQYQSYNQLLKNQQKICAAEQLAEDHYIYLSNRYLSDKGQRFYLADRAWEYWELVSSLMCEHSSSRLFFLGHLIHVFHYSFKGDYQGAAAANAQAVRHFEQTEGSLSLYLHPFLNHQLACYIRLKNLEAGTNIIHQLNRKMEAGSFDWFVYQRLYFLLAMHSKDYELGQQIIRRITSHRRFPYLPRTQSEKWTILQAYLYFLEKSGYIKQAHPKRSGFRPKEFLKAVPLYSRDKRGLNVPILVVSIIILLAGHHYQKAIERIEALEKYQRKYLKLDDAYRSNCFIKMLATLPPAGFHPKAAARKAEKHKKNLDQVPLPVATQAFELEIIPYEDLWEMVLNLL